MPKKFGSVIVSGGTFVSKYSTSHKKKSKCGPDPKPIIPFRVSPRNFEVMEITPIENTENRVIAFLVRLKDTPEILFFTKMKILKKFVFIHSNKEESIRDECLEIEKQYGQNYKVDWINLPNVARSYFDAVAFKLGGIIRKEYGLKKGDDYQAYFRKAFWFCNFDDKMIEEMVQSYFYKLTVFYNQMQLRNKTNVKSTSTVPKKKRRNKHY